MNHINAHNAEMVKHIADVEGHTTLLKGQLQQTEVHWNRAVADNARLHQQMAVLSARLEVTCTLLSCFATGMFFQLTCTIYYSGVATIRFSSILSCYSVLLFCHLSLLLLSLVLFRSFLFGSLCPAFMQIYPL